MIDLIRKAVQQYDVQVITTEQIDKDGDVFIIVSPDGKKYFLKIINEKKGVDYLHTENLYHTYEQLYVEMEILNALKDTPVKTAYPVSNRQGEYVSRLGNDMYATVTSYIDGVLMEEAADDPCEMAYKSGRAAAYLHNNSPNNLAIKRPHRDKIYIKQIMDRILEGVNVYKTITESEYEILTKGADCIVACMDGLDKDENKTKGLVHTDLRCGNFIYTNGLAIPIDFTRSVYGYYLYDLGEMCMHMGGMAPEAESEILRGYNSIRPLSVDDKQMVHVFGVMFLIILIAECIELKDNQWFTNTKKSLCELHIPTIQRYELFIND